MSAHTKEPWTDHDWTVTGPSAAAGLTLEFAFQKAEFGAYARVCQHKNAGKNAVAVALGETDGEASANAARIVACVNALAGMDDPVAEVARLKAEDHPGPHEKEQVLADLRRENDQLRAAVKLAEEFISNGIDLGYIQIPSHAADTATKTLPALRALLSKAAPSVPYPEFCRHKSRCAGLGNCPRDPACSE